MGATEVVAVMGAGVAEVMVAEVEAMVEVIIVVEVAEGVEVMVAEDTEKALVHNSVKNKFPTFFLTNSSGHYVKDYNIPNIH